MGAAKSSHVGWVFPTSHISGKLASRASPPHQVIYFATSKKVAVASTTAERKFLIRNSTFDCRAPQPDQCFRVAAVLSARMLSVMGASFGAPTELDITRTRLRRH